MRVVPVLYLASLAGLVFAGILAVYALTDIAQPLVPPIIAAAGFCAASAGWLFTNGITLQVKLREKAYEYIQHAIVDDKLTPRLKTINDEWRKPEYHSILADKSAFQAHFVENELANEPYISIQFALNFFNYIGLLVYRNAIDEVLVRDYYQSMLDRLYPRLAIVLPLIRNDPAVPGHRWGTVARGEIGFHCEWLARRWSERLEYYRQLEACPTRWARTKLRIGRVLVKWHLKPRPDARAEI